MNVRTPGHATFVPAHAREAEGRPGWLCLALGTGAGVLVAAGLSGIGSSRAPAGLADPGALTRRGLPLARVVCDVAAAGTVGVLLLALLMSWGGARAVSPHLLRVAQRWLACWVIASGLTLLLLWSEIEARPAWRLEPSPSSLDGLLALPTARALLATVGILSLLGAVIGRARSPLGVVGLLLGSAAGLAPALLTGHAIHQGQGGRVSVLVVAHVVAGTLWAGGLVALTLHLRSSDDALAVARRFRVVAVPSTAVLAGTGLAVAMSRHALTLGTGYGRLLVTKALVLSLLLWLGGRQGRLAIPQLARGHREAFTRLCRIELLLFGLVLVLAATLSSTHT